MLRCVAAIPLNIRKILNKLLYFLKQPEVITFSLALSTVAISLAAHEPWLDEAEAPDRIHSHGWDLWSLMRSFRRDGHFPVYHLLLFPIFNIGRAIGLDAFFLVKSFTFIQYSFIAYLTCKWVKFPISLLFLFSYYTIYEYGTISRCYLLSLLCLLIIYQSIISKPNISRPLLIGAYFIFPLTHSLSLIYASTLWVYLLVKRKWLEVIVLMTSALIAFYYLDLNLSQSNPLAQFPYLSSESLSFSEYVPRFLRSFSSAWIPFSSQSRWWNQSLVTEVSGIGLFIVLIIGLLAIFSILNLYTFNPLLLLASVTGSVGAIALLTVKYPHDFFRHTGYAVWPFLCLMAIVLSFKKEEKSSSSGSSSFSLYSRKSYKKLTAYSSIAILMTHSFFGLTAIYRDVRQNFSASIEKLQVLNELAESSGTPQIFANPCWSFAPIRALSNWRYISRPLWDPNGKNCSGTPDIMFSLSNVQYPDHIILSTWGYTINDKIIFTNVELNHQFRKSLGEFLSIQFSTCKLIREFVGTQDVDEYLYECKR